MKAQGTTAFVSLIILLAYAAVMFGASFAGLFGDTLMVWTALVALAAWGVLIGLAIRALLLVLAVRRGEQGRLDTSLAWTRAVLLAAAFLSVGTAALLSIGAFATCGPVWLAGLYHWGGLVGSLACFAAWLAMPRPQGEPRPWRPLLIGGAIGYGFWGLFWLVAWLLLRGSIDTAAYPARASSPYELPFPAGESAWVIQGNNSSFNHEGDEEHSWDFRRACGTPVLAARGGTVSRVTDGNTGHGKGKPNNLVEIDHGDGTVGRYLHIEQNSAKVKVGDTVSQGAHLANVGNVGNSLTGHIHFVVESAGKSIPVTFRDVEEDSGIPRTFESYTSGNR